MAINTQHVYTKADLDSLRKQMVNDQLVKRGITDKRVLKTMTQVPRHLFVPDCTIEEAYADGPLSIGFGQTISQPYMVAKVSELLELKGCENVLEIGAGCGYQAAVLGDLAKHVMAIECIPQLTDRAQAIVNELRIKNVVIEQGDGKFGKMGKVPFNGIVISCATPSVLDSWKDLLAEGGRIVFPEERGYFQMLRRLTKGKCGWSKEEDIFSVRYVPLR